MHRQQMLRMNLLRNENYGALDAENGTPITLLLKIDIPKFCQVLGAAAVIMFVVMAFAVFVVFVRRSSTDVVQPHPVTEATPGSTITTPPYDPAHSDATQTSGCFFYQLFFCVFVHIMLL